MAYLVKCPHCGRPKRIDVEHDEEYSAGAVKWDPVYSGMQGYPCPDCNEIYYVVYIPKTWLPKLDPPKIDLGPDVVWPWDPNGSIRLT